MRRKKELPKEERSHRLWLSQVDLHGLLLSEPVLNTHFPKGPEKLPDKLFQRYLREWERIRSVEDTSEKASLVYRNWLNFIFKELLNYSPPHWVTERDVPEFCTVYLEEHRETLKPYGVILNSRKPVFVVYKAEFAHSLDRNERGRNTWRASPTVKLERLLRGLDCPLGLVTNGLHFRLVYAPMGLPPSWITWIGESLRGDKLVLDAFYTFLKLARFIGEKKYLLIELCQESEKRQTELTESLGEQALKALEIFVKHAEIDGPISPQELHSAGLALMMRLVFILFAEERELLPYGLPLYETSYSLSRLLFRLEQEKREHPEIFRESYDAWPRIQALFRLIYYGCGHPDLPLRPYGGDLFNPEQYELLDSTRLKLSNEVVYEILKALTNTEAKIGRQKVAQRISYRTLQIEHIGHMYEGLLGYAVRENEEGRRILVPSGLRKRTGTYYTPKVLTTEVVRRTLRPFLAERKTPEEILSLKILDPAMGSGAFLVAAAEELAEALVSAWERRREEFPEATLVLPYATPAKGHADEEFLAQERDEMLLQARRLVVERCLYGVDVNPEAVELAKLSLWIESLSRNKPFTFLNAHLKCGNSLIGAWFFKEVKVSLGKYKSLQLHQLEFVPQEVFNKKETDLKRINKEDIENLAHGIKEMWSDLNFRKLLEKLIELRQEIDYRATSTPDDYRNKEVLLKHLSQTPEYQLLKAIGDTWCALWFWPKDVRKPVTMEYRDYLKTLIENFKESPLPVTNSLFSLKVKPKFIPEKRFWEIFFTVQKIVEKHRFFHWELEFPEVFLGKESGFHAVLSNPPWEKIKVEDKQFFAGKREDIVSARNAAERAKLIKALREEDPELYAEYQEAVYNADCLSNFLRHSGQYPLTAKGDINTYSIFAERARTLMGRPHGRVGLIIPTGIATDDTNKEFFQSIIQTGELAFLYDFENREGLFNIHRNYKFCLFGLLGKGGEKPELAFFLTKPEHLREEERLFNLSSEDFKLLNPNTCTCPIFRRKTDANLTIKIYRHCPVLVDETKKDGNPWGVSFNTMFHMSNDSHLFCTRDKLEAEGYKLKGNIFVKENDIYLPLYEAKMIWQFDHRFGIYEGVSTRSSTHLPTPTPDQYANPAFVSTPWYWVSIKNIWDRLNEWNRCWFIGFRNVTNATNERTAIFSLIPISGVGNSIPLTFVEKFHLIPCFLANLSSIVFDYVTRQKVGGTNLNFHYVKQLPVLLPNRFTEELILLIIPKVFELTYTAWDIKPFADDIWAEANEKLRSAIRKQWEENVRETGGHKNATPPDWLEIIYSLNPNNSNKNACPLPPFKWNEERRTQIRAELDAIFAHLYGLTREEFAYILDTFPIVRRKDEERFGEYRTKRLCLDQYDRFEGLIPHSKPLNEKPITKVISLEDIKKKKTSAPEKQTILYEELQTTPSSEYSFPKVAQPIENFAFSNNLKLIKEKIFDLLAESNRALTAEEIAKELKIPLTTCKKALTELIQMEIVEEIGDKFKLME